MHYVSRKDGGSYIGGKTKDSGSIKGRTYFYSTLPEAMLKADEFDDAIVVSGNGSYKVTKQ